MKSWIGLLLAVAAAVPAWAANERENRERDLRAFFEGQRVTVWIDMPATSKGVDVTGEAAEPERIAFGKVTERIAEYGVAIGEGARVPITKINLKDDTLEFHLAGGGFNWFWDTSGTVSPSYSGKSRNERELEKEIRDEKDPKRKRELERDLRDERRRREEDERRSREIADRENEIRKERDHDRALGEGSRFNVRFDKHALAHFATPQAVMEALSPWVDFSGFPGAEAYARPRHASREARRQDDDEPAASDDDGTLRAGLSRSEVQRRLGPPESEKSTREGDLFKSVAIFVDGGHRIEATFVNGVLVQFRQKD
jgi:hypothetical protein